MRPPGGSWAARTLTWAASDWPSPGRTQPQPATGTQTGKLGTSTSLLAGMRLALGEQEGGGGATITYVTAASVLAASSNAAVAGVVRAPLPPARLP